MQGPDDWKPNVVVGAGEDVGAAVTVGAGVGAGVVGAGVGRDGTRHTRQPEAPLLPSEYHEMIVDELTATQSGPEEPE